MNYAICTRCKRIVRLNKPLNDYRREPQCPHCGGGLVCATQANVKPVTICKHSCMPHPHHRGSKYCRYNVDGSRRHIDQYKEFNVDRPYYD